MQNISRDWQRQPPSSEMFINEVPTSRFRTPRASRRRFSAQLAAETTSIVRSGTYVAARRRQTPMTLMHLTFVEAEIATRPWNQRIPDHTAWLDLRAAPALPRLQAPDGVSTAELD